MSEDRLATRDFDELCRMIVARRATLPKRLAQVATYVVEHPEDIAFETAARVAENAGVQPSTLVRFSQVLGYSGFSDFKSVFQARLRDRVPDYEARLAALKSKADASAAGILFAGFCDVSERSIQNLRATIDLDSLDRAVGILAAADTIYLAGRRRSFPVVSYMAYALGKLGIRAHLVGSEAGIEAETIATATKRDAVLAVSFTPYLPETAQLAAAAAGNNVPVVAITDSPFSPLVEHANAILEVTEADFEGFRPLAGAMALAMTLTVAVGGAVGH